jgi:hypothetical protein
MASLSAMIQLELPHINILSKMDLVSNKKDVEEYAICSFTLCFSNVLKLPFFVPLMFFFIPSYLNPEAAVLLSQLNREMAPRFGKLNKALADLVCLL